MTFPSGNGRTKQSFKDECDINQIMARYQKTGILDFTAKHAAQYGDATGIEFQQGMEIITRAQAMFADLPSSTRAKFHNDPGEFLDFCHDPANRSQMAEMGLLRPDYIPPTPEAPASQDAATARVEAPTGPKQGSDGEKPPVPKSK